MSGVFRRGGLVVKSVAGGEEERGGRVNSVVRGKDGGLRREVREG